MSVQALYDEINNLIKNNNGNLGVYNYNPYKGDLNLKSSLLSGKNDGLSALDLYRNEATRESPSRWQNLNTSRLDDEYSSNVNSVNSLYDNQVNHLDNNLNTNLDKVRADTQSAYELQDLNRDNSLSGMSNRIKTLFDKQSSDEQMGLDNLERNKSRWIDTSNQNLLNSNQSAWSNMAATGGLDSGARERIASNNSFANMMNTQDIYGKTADQYANITDQGRADRQGIFNREAEMEHDIFSQDSMNRFNIGQSERDNLFNLNYQNNDQVFGLNNQRNSSLNDLMSKTQSMKHDLSIQDEGNRLNMLGNLPGQELNQASYLDGINRDNMNRELQQYDKEEIMRSKSIEDFLKMYGANRQAAAMRPQKRNKFLGIF